MAVQTPIAPPARYSLTLDCASEARAEDRRKAADQFKRGEAAIMAEKWSEAETILEGVLALDPLMALAHYGLGQTYMAQKRYKEAVEAFSTSRQAFGCVPWTEEDRKKRLEEIRALKAAIQDADRRRLQELGVKWKEVNGDGRTSGDRMREVLAAQQRVEELEATVNETNPAPPGVTLALGTALFQIGALAEAETEFRAVLARMPGSGDAHHNLALICTLTDRLEEAAREIAAAEKAGVPIHPRLREELARRKLLKKEQ